MAELSEDLNYSDAIEELEDILDDIDDEEVGLDQLTEKVERAAELITFCRSKIESTEMRLDTIIEDLEEELGAEDES